MAVMAAATVVADFTAEAVAASMAAVQPFAAVDFVVVARPFTAAVSAAAAPCSMAADFVQVTPFTAAFATVDIDSHTGTIFTGATFTGMSIMRRPIIPTRAATAGWSGLITDRARSAAIVRGTTTTGATITGTIATIDEVELERDDFSSNRHPALSFCLSMVFFGKPVPTFPDHASASCENESGARVGRLICVC